MLGKQILDSIGFTEKMGGDIGNFEISPIVKMNDGDFRDFKAELNRIDKDPVQVDVLLKTYGLEQIQGLKEYILKNDVKQGSVNGLIETQNFTNIANQAHGFIGVNAAIKEYNLLIDKADGSSQKFVDTISKSNAGLGKYLSGLNGTKTGILSYGVSLVGATVKTFALEAATMALNATISFGISAGIQLLIGLFDSFIKTSSEVTEELQSQIEKHDENIQKIDEEISKLESEKDKLESVKTSLNDAIGDKQKLAEVQGQLNELLGYTPNLLNAELDAIKDTNTELAREIALKEEAIQKEKEKRKEEEKGKQKSYRDLVDKEKVEDSGINTSGAEFRANLWNNYHKQGFRKNEETGELEYYEQMNDFFGVWYELEGYAESLENRKQNAHKGWEYLTEQYSGKLGQGFALQILDSLVEQGYGSGDITELYEKILKSLKADIDPLIEKYYQTGSQEDYDALRAGLNKVGGMYWQHNQLGAFDTNLTEDALSIISKAFEAGTESSKKYEESLASVSSTLKGLSGAAESLKPLQDAFKELTDDGFITNKTLLELHEEFKDVSGIDGYIQKLSSANLTTKEAQQILGELAIAKIEDRVLTGDLKNAAEDQIVLMLKEAGVANAVAVAQDLVRKRKLEGILASDDYAYASGHVKDALVDELEKLGLTETEVGELSSAYQAAQIAMTEAANKQLLDRLGLLESELEGIQSVAEAYALLAGKDSWTSVDDTKYSVDILEDSYQYSNIQDENFLATRQWYEKDKSQIIKYAQLKEDLQRKIDDISKVKNPIFSDDSKTKETDIMEDLAEKEKQFAEDMAEAWKEEHLAQLEDGLAKQKDIIDRYKKNLETTDFGLDLIEDDDFENKADLLSTKLSSLTSYGIEMRKEFERIANITPQTADEAKALADRLEELGSDMRSNISTIREVNVELQKLAIEAAATIADKHLGQLEQAFDRLDRRIEILNSDYKKEYKYTNKILSTDLLLPTYSDFDKARKSKQKSDKELIKTEQNTQNKINDIVTKSLEMQIKENSEAREKERQNLIKDMEKVRKDAKEKLDEIHSDYTRFLDGNEDATQKSISNISDIVTNIELKLPEVDISSIDRAVELIKQKLSEENFFGDNNDFNLDELQKRASDSKYTKEDATFNGKPTQKANGCVMYVRSRIHEDTGNGGGYVAATDPNAGYGAKTFGYNLSSDKRISPDNRDAFENALMYGSVISMTNQAGSKHSNIIPAAQSDLGHVIFVEGYDSSTDTVYYTDNTTNDKLKKVKFSDLTSKNGITGIVPYSVFKAVGTPLGNAQAKNLGIAGENYKPEILIDKATGEKTYIDEPTVIDLNKTDVVGEKQTAKLPKFAEGTLTTDEKYLEIISGDVSKILSNTNGENSENINNKIEEIGKFYDKASNTISLIQGEYLQAENTITNSDLSDDQKTEKLLNLKVSLGNEVSEVGYEVYENLKSDFISWFEDVKSGKEDWSLDVYNEYVAKLGDIGSLVQKFEDEKVDALQQLEEIYTQRHESKVSDIQHNIDMVLNKDPNANVTSFYQQLQSEYHTEAERLRAIDPEKYKERIQELQQLWWDAQKSIDDYYSKYLSKYVDNATELYDIHQNEKKYINDLQWALNNLVMTDEERLEIQKKINNARKQESEEAIGDIDHELFLLEQNGKGTSDEAINLIKDRQNLRHKQSEERKDELRKQGISEKAIEKDDIIQNLQKEDAKDNQQLEEIYTQRHESKVSDIQHNIDMVLNKDPNANVTSFYQQLQSEYHTEAERLRAIDPEKYKERIQELQQLWWDAAEKIKNNVESIYSNISNNIDRYTARIIERYEDEIDALEKQKNIASSILSIKEKQYEIINAIADAQHEADKEIEKSRRTLEYLDKDMVDGIFNEDDYAKITDKIEEISDYIADETKIFENKINSLGTDEMYLAETITAEYERRVEMKKRELEIVKAEVDLQKKKDQLDNVLANRNTRVFRDGQWTWTYDNEKAQDAIDELSEAEYNLDKAKREKTQQADINNRQTAIDNLTNEIGVYEENIKRVNDATEDLEEAIDEIINPVLNIGAISDYFAKYGVGTVVEGFNDLLDSLSKLTGKKYKNIAEFDEHTDYSALMANYSKDSLEWFILNQKRNAKIDALGLSYEKYASGTSSAKPGLSLIGEKKPELLFTKNGLYPITSPILTKLQGGEIVFNQAQLKSLGSLWNYSQFNSSVPYLLDLAQKTGSTGDSFDNSIHIGTIEIEGDSQDGKELNNILRRITTTH